MKKGKPFWFYPTRIEQGEISGYRWYGKKWTFYGFDPESIDQLRIVSVKNIISMWASCHAKSKAAHEAHIEMLQHFD